MRTASNHSGSTLRLALTACFVFGWLLTGTIHSEVVPISVLGDDTRRALVVRVLLRADDSAELVDAFISDTPPRTNIGDPPQILVEHFDAGGNLIGSRFAWDPRWEFIESKDGTGEQKVDLSEARGSFDVPLSAGITSLRLTKLQDEGEGPDFELLTVDVAQVIEEFCVENLADPNCVGFTLPPIIDLEGRRKSAKVSLTWTPVPYAVAYNVYRRVAGANPFELVARDHQSDYATYADDGLLTGLTYEYLVRWTNENGAESPDSNTASFADSTRRRR